MANDNSDKTRDEIIKDTILSLSGMEDDILLELLKDTNAFINNARKLGYGSQNTIIPYSALLTCLNSIRQKEILERHEKLLKQMNIQSTAMFVLSILMAILTGAILWATIVLLNK